ncbi:UDP-N-acetylmuramoyl-L-alanine--D-glutamate ligase [bacterium]|nr:MAG: UDP-N-acetylmuramoyl-L-alanine--D-glutamate ligase [bacterium]
MRKVSIIGLARSGEAVAYLALSDGFDVFVSDVDDTPQLRQRAQKLREANIRCELGGHSERILDADIIVVSPGVPLDIQILQSAGQKNIPIISEVEFAYRHEQGKVIGVTGSNGKSTTATLIARILADSGIRTILAGNIGNPYSANVIKTSPDSVSVIELSSFQLEAMDTFCPHIAVMLNLSPDHIDRYNTVESYYEAKFHIFDNQGETDYAVLFADQPEVASLSNQINSQPIWFSIVSEKHPGAFVKNSMIYRDQEEILSPKKLGIPGPHNLANALAAVASTIPLDIQPDSIATTLENFEGIEHRLERFLQHNGITFVNDSKSTNPDSLKFALLSFERPIILIAGGYDKGNDFHSVREIFQQKVKSAVFTGQTGNKMAEQLAKNLTHCAVIPDFDKAVQRAVSLARPGDVLMLSPGCASFDSFSNFEQRGNYFKKLVKMIISKKKISQPFRK